MKITVHMKITFKTILMACCLAIAATATCSAQDKVWVGHNCEDALAQLDISALEARKDPQTSIIVIARLGAGERPQTLNDKRLVPMLGYLRGKASNSVIGASGERVKGYGRIEVYVAGKLFYVQAYRKNRLIDCNR